MLRFVHIQGFNTKLFLCWFFSRIFLWLYFKFLDFNLLPFKKISLSSHPTTRFQKITSLDSDNDTRLLLTSKLYCRKRIVFILTFADLLLTTELWLFDLRVQFYQELCIEECFRFVFACVVYVVSILFFCDSEWQDCAPWYNLHLYEIYKKGEREPHFFSIFSQIKSIICYLCCSSTNSSEICNIIILILILLSLPVYFVKVFVIIFHRVEKWKINKIVLSIFSACLIFLF